MTEYAVAAGLGEKGEHGLYITSGVQLDSLEKARSFVEEVADGCGELREITDQKSMRFLAPDGKERTTVLTFQLDDGKNFNVFGVLEKDWANDLSSDGWEQVV